MASSQIVGSAFGAVLAQLHRACFERPWETAAFVGLLDQPHIFAWLASDDERPCGFIVMSIAADEAEILTLGVLPDHRRHKIADQLLRDFLTSPVARDVTRVHLEVAEDNQPARAFYQTKGFRVAGRRPAYYRGTLTKDKDAHPAVDALILTLEVKPEKGKSGAG